MRHELCPGAHLRGEVLRSMARNAGHAAQILECWQGGQRSSLCGGLVAGVTDLWHLPPGDENHRRTFPAGQSSQPSPRSLLDKGIAIRAAIHMTNIVSHLRTALLFTGLINSGFHKTTVNSNFPGVHRLNDTNRMLTMSQSLGNFYCRFDAAIL